MAQRAAPRRFERPENSPEPIQNLNAPLPLGLTIFQLTDTTCRFPLDERDSYGIYKFCGHKTREGSPYCAHHHDRCHTRTPVPQKTTATYRAAA